jgi:FtsP/CotA-like multicopper oxidase with cupredoxin domain
VVRLWLTNTANTRVFNLAVPGTRLKLVGGDSGRVEHEEFVESVVLAPRSGRWSTCWSTGRGSFAWSTTPRTVSTGWPP